MPNMGFLVLANSYESLPVFNGNYDESNRIPGDSKYEYREKLLHIVIDTD